MSELTPAEEPNTLATPEGDNEQLPEQPLVDEPAPLRPPGDEPHPAGVKNPAE